MSKTTRQTIEELDRERSEVFFRTDVFARRKGCRQPAEVVKAKARVRAARWRTENDRVGKPETSDVALALFMAMVRLHDLESVNPEDRSIIGLMLADLTGRGYDLKQIRAVCKRARKRALAEDRSTEESRS
jgi:hypothetical protein